MLAIAVVELLVIVVLALVLLTVAGEMHERIEMYRRLLESKFTVRALQERVRIWNEHNFPNKKPHQPLLGVCEEAGELAHAHLKQEQGIRGTAAEHLAAKEDAATDIMVYLCDYCTQSGIDLEAAVLREWPKVERRDWIKFPKDGLTQ